MKKINYLLLIVFFVGAFFYLVPVNGFVDINPIIIKTVIGEGQSVNTQVSVINLLGRQKLTIDYFPVNDFIFVEEKELELGKDEGATFNVFLDGKDKEAGVYVGEISISGKTENIKIPIVMEIETFSPLFDVTTESLQSFSGVVPGGEFVVDINIHKLKGQNDGVILNYFIVNTKDGVILSESQNLNVANQLQLTKSFLIPEDAELGNYVFYVMVRDKAYLSTGTSAIPFSISSLQLLKAPENFPNYFSLAAFFIIIILIALFLLFNYLWSRKSFNDAKHWNKKLVQIKKTGFSDAAKKIRMLQRQKEVLKKAYSAGYIRKQSYEKGKKKTEEMIIRLKKRL